MQREYKGVKIFIDNGQELGYETNDILKKTINFFLIPILNRLPKNFQKHIKKSHRSAAEVIEYATTHRAVEILYKKGTTHASQSIWQKIMWAVWFNTNNAKAVRNRLRLVERELKHAINTTAVLRDQINLLSIASGSARAVVEVLFSLHSHRKTISVKFLDKNPEAIEYSKDLTKTLPKNYHLDWIIDTASNFPKYYGVDKKPDIIEMVGLMDYFHDPWAIRLLTLIRENLNLEGVLITANIIPNSEQKFISNAVGWKMIYRTPEDLIDLALAAGFEKNKIKIIYEPLKIHAVLIARK